MFACLLNCLLFFILSFGLAWPLAARLRLDPAEKLVAAVMLSLLAAYLGAFGIYLLHLPYATYWLLPGLACAGLIRERAALREVLRDPVARALLVGQLLVSGWCAGWLFFVDHYAGGGWIGDWLEHWARARFFLEHWARDIKFFSQYSLPARPPLANLVTGALLAVTPGKFPHYLLFTTLLNSLAFLPAALLVRRFQSRLPAAAAAGAPAAIALFTVLLMLNPSWVQNATFAWTKLITAGFVLSGLYFFLRMLDPDAPRAAGPLCATALAAALLAHYSAGPYVLLLALSWPLVNHARWRDPAFWRQTALLGLIGALVLATWFGWSVAVYGLSTTLHSHSSGYVPNDHPIHPLWKIALNLRDTIVPHFLRPLDGTLIAQRSPWGYWQDWLFQLYQLNLFFIFGSVAWLVLLRELARTWFVTVPRRRWSWALLVSGVIVLGVAVVGSRDTWGLAHICLQALVLLGLAFLAAHWPRLGRGWRAALVAGAVVDFCLGIALHFGVQSHLLDHWFAPDRTRAEMLQSYTLIDQWNARQKSSYNLEYFRDSLPQPDVLVLALLGGILTLAIVRANRHAR